jgi:hypothetical protein
MDQLFKRFDSTKVIGVSEYVSGLKENLDDIHNQVKSGLNNLQSKKDAACAFAPKLFYASGTFVFLNAPPLTVARRVGHEVGVSTLRAWHAFATEVGVKKKSIRIFGLAIKLQLIMATPLLLQLVKLAQALCWSPSFVTMAVVAWWFLLPMRSSTAGRPSTSLAACVLLASISRSTASVALVIAAQPLVETEAFVHRTIITLIVVVVTALLFGGHLNCLLVRRRCVDVEVQTEPWVQTQWFQFTVPELRAACQERRLRHSGLKGELAHALVEHEMRLS